MTWLCEDWTVREWVAVGVFFLFIVLLVGVLVYVGN
jgi:hypothetical protein